MATNEPRAVKATGALPTSVKDAGKSPHAFGPAPPPPRVRSPSTSGDTRNAAFESSAAERRRSNADGLAIPHAVLQASRRISEAAENPESGSGSLNRSPTTTAPPPPRTRSASTISNDTRGVAFELAAAAAERRRSNADALGIPQAVLQARRISEAGEVQESGSLSRSPPPSPSVASTTTAVTTATAAAAATATTTTAQTKAMLLARDPQFVRAQAELARAYLERMEKDKHKEEVVDSKQLVGSRSDRPGRPDADSPQLEEQRKKIVAELVATEQTYIAGLLSLMQHYLQPLVQRSARGNGVRDARALEAFLGSTQCMATLHTKLFVAWETDKSLGGVVSQLSIHVPFLRQYWPYMQGYPLLLLEFTEQASAPLSKFLTEVAATQKHLGVAQLLILPVQRIPRYVLLLEAIEKFTPNSHPELENLENTLAKVRALASELNEYQLNCENSTKLFFLHNQIKGLPDDWPILRPSRLLLKDGVMCKSEGDVRAKHPHKHTVRWFLFNVALVITDWNYKYLDRLDLELMSPSEGGGSDVSGWVLELLTGLNADERIPGNGYILSTVAERNEWMTAMLTARYSLINYRSGTAGRAAHKRNSVQVSLNSSNASMDRGADDETHEKLNVYMRIRPFVTDNERKDGTVCLTSKGSVVTLQQLGSARADRVANYDYVFGPSDDQAAVFEVVGEECLGAIFAGFDVAIIAYGNTGAGKSYTMFGALDKDGNFVYAKPPLPPPPVTLQVGDLGWVLTEAEQSRSVEIVEPVKNGRVKVEFFDTHETAVLAEHDIIRGNRTNSDVAKSSDPRGLIPRLLEWLFEVFENDTEYEAADVSISYMQLYNDKIHDLQKPDLPEIALRMVGHTWVPLGLTETKVHNIGEAVELIRLGNSRRVTRLMKMSEMSSRSHAIVGVKVTFTRRGKRTTSSVRFIDLAGAEALEPDDPHAHKLDAAMRRLREEERALAREESKYINVSLVALQRVVYALILNEKLPKKDRKQVPFKDNKLTWLLMDVLEGEFLCTLILNASPSPVDNQVSLSARTIAFGEGVKKLDTDRKRGNQTTKSDSFLSNIWASVSKPKR